MNTRNFALIGVIIFILVIGIVSLRSCDDYSEDECNKNSSEDFKIIEISGKPLSVVMVEGDHNNRYLSLVIQKDNEDEILCWIEPVYRREGQFVKILALIELEIENEGIVEIEGYLMDDTSILMNSILVNKFSFNF